MAAWQHLRRLQQRTQQRYDALLPVTPPHYDWRQQPRRSAAQNGTEHKSVGRSYEQYNNLFIHSTELFHVIYSTALPTVVDAYAVGWLAAWHVHVVRWLAA